MLDCVDFKECCQKPKWVRMVKSCFNVLYIDDDEFMLKAASRLLKRLKPDWSITLIQDPTTWREFVASLDSPPDLVMSDLIMPQLKGDMLLEQVSEYYPSSIRALITGDTTVDIDSLTNSWTHFILPKPFSEQDFQQILNCTERLGNSPFTAECRQKLSAIEPLPLLPKVIRQLRASIEDEQCGCVDCVDIIAQEPSLAAQIIKVANSAYLGFDTKTSSLNNAVSRLGLNIILALATAMVSHRAFKRVSEEQHSEIVNKHQLLAETSVSAAKVLEWTPDMQDRVYLVCLLSSIGVLTLLELGYSDIDSKPDCLNLQTGLRDSDVLSAYLLILWGYDLDLAEANLCLGTAATDDDPANWTISNVAVFAQDLLENKAKGTLDQWRDLLPESQASLAYAILNPVN